MDNVRSSAFSLTECRGMTGVMDGPILERIRVRPALYLGTHSLTALSNFLNGYSLALHESGMGPVTILPQDFHDWVAYRLHFRESTSGYAGMILKRIPDEVKALQRFFELYDEHISRKASVIATVQTHPKDPDVKIATGLDKWRQATVATEISLVAYSDDQGFFVEHAEEVEFPQKSRFYPSLSRLEEIFKPNPEYTTIHDPALFRRLILDSEMFERELQAERVSLESTGKKLELGTQG